MKVIMHEYKVVNEYGRKPKIREIPTIIIGTNSWEGDETLFKKLTSKRDRERIKVMSNDNREVLDKIKKLLVEYVTK